MKGFFDGLEIQTELNQSELFDKVSLLTQLCEYTNVMSSIVLDDSGKPADEIIAGVNHLTAVGNQLAYELILILQQTDAMVEASS